VEGHRRERGIIKKAKEQQEPRVSCRKTGKRLLYGKGKGQVGQAERAGVAVGGNPPMTSGSAMKGELRCEARLPRRSLVCDCKKRVG